MSESTTPAQDTAAATPAPAPAPEWKPEPRQWTWRDLFTAPMLAFKPKCMAVSAITLLALGVWMWLYQGLSWDEHGTPLRDVIYQWSSLLSKVVEYLWFTAALVIFSLGASLVAVFMKADLLDDEFLSFGEAWTQYRPRILSALLVPVFLMGLLAATNLVLVWLPLLVAGIPYVGPAIYALLYPLGFLAALFVVLLGIAVWLSVFVFPAIVAIRRHGWFDNVVDTVEAVGTKPHLLFGSLLLSLLMMFVAQRIGFAGMDHLKTQSRTQTFKLGDTVWSNGVHQTEAKATSFVTVMRDAFDIYIIKNFDTLKLQTQAEDISILRPQKNYYLVLEPDGFYQVTGVVVGCWEVLIAALILGYGMNLFISGGMLSYLVVREDDYWDDEDLEDLDQLAKELEDEAKREQAGEASAANPTPAEEAPKPDNQGKPG